MSAPASLLYGTRAGRLLLAFLQKSRADRLIVKFLRSPLSRPCIGLYIRRHHIPMQEYGGRRFRTFQEFFAREKELPALDRTPARLSSPCDGCLSAYPITEDSRFLVKGSYYRLSDFLEGSKRLPEMFQGGTCLVFRLTPADYHHYCAIDDGFLGKHHFIPGTLHSVQPAACEAYPVYTLNRRVWTPFATENFGKVVQVEIGAFVVGGIVNEGECCRISRGAEMGHFELAGSTIVLLFQRDAISLLPHIAQLAAKGEVRVRLGMHIGNAVPHT